MKLTGNGKDKFHPPNQMDILQLILEINYKLDNLSEKRLYDVWLPKKAVLRYFDYGETQMRQLEKEYSLEVSKIKARKFYSVQSILNLIEQHKKTKNEDI